MRPNPTVSELDRLFRCQASHVLPHAKETTELSEKGTDTHAELAELAPLVVSFQKGEVGALAAQHSSLTKAIGDLKSLEIETSYAYHLDNQDVRVLGHNLGRSYPAPDASLIYGSEDLCGVRSDGVPVTLDWKSGEDVGPVRQRWQSRVFAWFRALITASPRVEARIAYVSGTAVRWVERCEFSFPELQSYAEELTGLAQSLRTLAVAHDAGQPVAVHLGSWCKYCAAAHACPGKLALVRAFVAQAKDWKPEDIDRYTASLSLPELGAAYERVSHVLPLAERLQKAIKERALKTPVPLPDGRELRSTSYKRLSLVQHRLVSLAKKRGATTEELASCYESIDVTPVRPMRSSGEKDT